MDINYLRSLISAGYNCMAINADKTPKGRWKDYQDKAVENIVESDNYALICGFNDVEVIDVDLKILPSKIERDEFIKKLFAIIDDNIEDFKKKIVIKKTQNSGYHLIYKAKNIEGNLKLATLDNHKEAIIETRGLGGYVVMYDQVIENRNYHDIQYIEDEERECIISLCRLFNEKQEHDLPIPIKTEKQYKIKEDNVTPWQDYNNKTSIFDVIGNEFMIVPAKIANKTVIKRHGAKSKHSGYVYNNSGCMYLFSTGTIYPAQKLISPFHAYAIKNYNGDFGRAASHLYGLGFGDRKRPEFKEPVIKIKQQNQVTDFPLDVFPKELGHYISECNRTLNSNIDYMGCALLWIGSLVIGNSLVIEVKKGWTEISTVWIAVVGNKGIGKTPSTENITKPLERINGMERRRYSKAKKEYEAYLDLSKDEKQQAVEVKEPVKTAFIVDDVTIESLINLHSQQQNGIGVYKDELAGWFKDMNKYKEGSDKEQWLSSWSGKGISVDRITRESDYIEHPILPVLGGIQPGIFATFFTDENKDSGFLDRMLFTFPEMGVNEYSEAEIESRLLNYYNDFIVMFYEEMRKIVVFNEFGDIEPSISSFSPEAKREWIRIFNDITSLQNSDDTPEMIKGMLAKQKTYIPRFSLIINTFQAANDGISLLNITKESILKAEKLSKYFIAMNEKMILFNFGNMTAKEALKNSKGGSINEKIEAIFKADPEFNRSEVARELNVSRRTILRHITKITENEKSSN
jgi:DNA-binding transcriptional ArsR family regulator